VIEVDFAEVVTKKINVIRSNETMLELIRNKEIDGDIQVVHDKHINSHQYKLFA
jgi:hypothetical protein